MRVERIHRHRQILQSRLIPLVNGLFLLDVGVQEGNLAPDHPGDQVRHAVIVADFLVLIPGRGFPALGGPFPNLVSVLLAVGQEHAARRSGNNLVAVERNAVVVADGAGFNPTSLQLVLCAQGFRRVLYDQGAVGVRDLSDLVHFPGRTVEVCQHDQFHFRIPPESFLQRVRIHVPGIPFRVDEHGFSVLIGHGVHRGVKRHVRAENPVPGQSALIRLCPAVQAFPGELCRQVQRGSAGRQAHRILHADDLRDGFFCLVNVPAHGADPVGGNGVIHKALFVPMHGR